jgi:hypothetical protein
MWPQSPGAIRALLPEFQLLDVLLVLQFIVLVYVFNTLSGIKTLLANPKVLSAVVEPPASARSGGDANYDGNGAGSGSQSAASSGPKPTVETLIADTPKGVSKASGESELLSEAELDTLCEMKGWLDADGEERYRKLPHDLLISFMRGYAYRTDWAAAAYAYFERALTWRVTIGADATVPLALRTGDADGLPPRRALFESQMQCGPIGVDAHGHPVVLEREFVCSPTDILESFDFATFIRHMAFNRECLRAWCGRASEKEGKRLYKSVLVMDLAGLSFAHSTPKFVERVRGYNTLFGSNYPETVHKFYMVNAPGGFSMLYAIIKPFLHPITQAKIEVCGSDYAERLARDGVRMFDPSLGGKVPSDAPSWLRSMAELRTEMAGEPGGVERLLRENYLSEADAKRMRARGLLPPV